MRWQRHLFVLGAAAVGFGILALYWKTVSARPEAPTAADRRPAAVASQQAPFVTFVDPSKGPADAAVTIIEFGDHACPHCRTAQAAVDRLMAAHPTAVRFVWKSAPSPIHPGSQTAAEAALCAARQGRFWEFHAALFERADMLDEASMAILSGELGLDTTAFVACLSNHETAPLVERTSTEARALGLTGIPTMYVNGVRYDGALTYDQLLEASGL